MQVFTQLLERIRSTIDLLAPSFPCSLERFVLVGNLLFALTTQQSDGDMVDETRSKNGTMKPATSRPIRYAYLHGFASSPLAHKAVQLSRWFRDELNLSLDVPDLNVPSFREQSLTRIVDHMENYIASQIDRRSHSVLSSGIYLESNSGWLLIGSSFGGLAATLLAQRQPTSIRALLLLAPAFDPVQIWTSKMNIEQWKAVGFMDHHNPTTQSDEPVAYDFFCDLERHPSHPLVTTCPLSIIHGVHDDMLPIDTSREYIKRLRAASKHPVMLTEVDDDHHLAKPETLETIKRAILQLDQNNTNVS